jgi:hypothetical protein
MNRVPAAVADCDDETGVSSPNSTLSSFGKRSEREQIGEEIEAERTSWHLGYYWLQFSIWVGILSCLRVTIASVMLRSTTSSLNL